jgi:hypothetical protein
MPIYTVQGPDGRLYDLEGPDGMTEQQLGLALHQQLQEQAKTARGGFWAAAKAGTAGLGQDLTEVGANTGIRSLDGAKRSIAEAEAYKQRTFRPEAPEGLEGWLSHPWAKFKETLGGSVPYMAGPIAGGVAGTMVGGPVGGMIGAGLASLTQFTGSNLSRQREEGAEVGQGDLGSAAAAAVPQAALDVIGLRFIPGIRRIFATAGTKIDDAAAREVANKVLSQVAIDYTKAAGKAATVEGLTEAGQQFLERLQAGLSTTDPEARREYLESMVGGAVVGGTIGVPGRTFERSKLRDETDRYDREQRAAQAAQLEQQEAQRRQQLEARVQDPAYLDDLEKRYAEFMQRYAELGEQSGRSARKALDPNDLAGKAAIDKLAEQRRDMARGQEFTELMREMEVARPHILRRRQQRAADQEAEASAQAWREEASQKVDQSPEAEAGRREQYIDQLERDATAAQKAGDERTATMLREKALAARDSADPVDLPDYDTWQSSVAKLEGLRDEVAQRNKELAESGASAQERLAEAQRLTQIEEAHKRLTELGKKIEKPAAPKDPDREIKRLEKLAQKAVDEGRSPEKWLTQITELERQPSLFDEQRNATFANEAQLAEEMARGREEAAARRQKLEQEIAALNRMGERGMDSPEFIAALERATRTTPDGQSDFAPPEPRGETLHLSPAQRAMREKHDARQQLQRLKQKEGNTGPWGNWLELKRQDVLNRYKRELATMQEQQANDARIEQLEQEIAELRRDAADAQNVGAARPEAMADLPMLEQELKRRRTQQTQYQPLHATPPSKLDEAPEDERGVNLSDVSDANVEKLLDHYLPKAVRGTTAMGDKTKLRNQIMAAQEERADAFFELAHFMQDVLRNKPEQWLEAVSKKKRFIEAAVKEADLRSQYNGAGKLDFDEKWELRAILEDVAHDLYRLSIVRTSDNSYRYGQVQGFVEGRVRREGVPSAEEAAEYQNELQDQRRLRFKMEEELGLFEQGEPGHNLIRTTISMVDARINELTAILGDYIAVGPTQVGVIPHKRQGSDAPLTERAIGTPGKALDVLEEMTDDWVEFYAKADKDPAQEAKRPGGPKGAVRVVKTPGKTFAKPALDNFELLEKLRATQDEIRELNISIRNAGNPKGDKLEAVKALREHVDWLKEEFARLREEYGNREGLASKRLPPEEKAPPQPPEQEKAPEPLPGQMSLPGMRPFNETFAPKMVGKEKILEARTAVIKAQDEVVALRKEVGKAEMALRDQPKFDKEVAEPRRASLEKDVAAAQRTVDGFQTRIDNIGKRLTKAFDQRAPREERDRLQALIDKAAQDKADADEVLAKAKTKLETHIKGVEAAQRDAEEVNKLKAKLDAADKRLQARRKDLAELIVRSRKGEQQQAAREGRDLGELEADKITSGKPNGFRTHANKRLPTRPKDARSWVVQNREKVAAATPAPTATQRAEKLLAAAREKRAMVYKGSPQERMLKAQADSREGASKLLSSLAEQGITPLVRTRERYDEARKMGGDAVTNFAKELDAEVTKAKESLSSARQKADAAYAKYEAARKKVDDDYSATAGLTYSQFEATAQASERALEAQEDAERAYMRALADRMEVERLLGEDFRQAYLVAANTPRNAADAEVREAQVKWEAAYKAERAEREEKIAAERNAARIAAQKQREDASRKQSAKLVAAERRQTGEITGKNGQTLDAVRLERDTAGPAMTRLQNNLKKQYAAASTELDKAEAPALQAREVKKGLEMLRDELRKPETTDKRRAEIRERMREMGARLHVLRGQIDAPLIEAARQTKRRLEQQIDRLFEIAPRERTEETRAQEMEWASSPDSPVGKMLDELPAAQRLKAQRAKSPAPLEGVRLPKRREGAAVRNVSGPSKRVLQSGMAKLTAEGLNTTQASQISMFVTKTKMEASEGKAKEKLAKKWETMTAGLSEDAIRDMVAEGERLSGQGPTAKTIAARERLRGALAAVDAAQAELAKTKGPAQRELVQEKVEAAEAERDAAEKAWEAAKDEYERSQLNKVKKEVKGDSPKGKQRARKDAEKGIGEDERVRARSEIQKLIDESDELEADELDGDAPAADDDDTAYSAAKRYAPRSTELANAAVTKALWEGRLLDALREIVRSSHSPLLRAEAGRLIPLLGDTGVEVVPSTHLGKDHAAAYRARDNMVLMNSGGAFTNNDVVHEATHAATLRVLRMPEGKLTAEQRRAKAELTAMVKSLKNDPTLADEYGMENVEEFVAELRSNDMLRNKLSGKKWAQGNWLQRFMQRVLELLGWKRGDATMLEYADHYIEHISTPATAFDTEQLYVPSVMRRQPTEYDEFIARKPTFWSDTRNLGMRLAIDFVDRLRGYEEGIKRAKGAGKLTEEQATQALYSLRFSENHNQAVSQFITAGPVFLNKEKLATGGTAWFYDSKKDGPTLQRVFQHVGDMGRALGVDHEQATDMATVVANGQRAEAMRGGWFRLSGEKAEAHKALYERTLARINADPKAKQAMEAAMREYRQYNAGLINFLKETGAIEPEYARALTTLPYAPWYRIDGESVKLISENEKPLVIGNIRDQPELAKLLGNDNKTMNLLDGAVKNTYLITRMAMKNQQASEMAATLWRSGFASKYGKGAGPAGKNVIHFKVDGEDYHAVVDKDMFGMDAELIAMGLEGIKTTLPWLVRMMQVPANWVRKFVTRSPAYVIRQLARDPINAVFVHGMDPSGALDAFRQMGKSIFSTNETEQALMRALVVTSNIYTNNTDDVASFLAQAAKGNRGWGTKAMLKLDEIAQQADAATRTALYDDAIKKGMSHTEASLRALESMNFNRRGRSPTVHMLATMIPFFNAGLQGMDVLYRSMAGKAPMQEKLRIQQKLIARGLMLMSATAAYALMMSDDEEYRKLKPQDRYQNFHIRVPGVKDFVKIPIPYEFGVIFKALPEALIDAAREDQDTSDAIKGLAYVASASIPKPWEVSGIAPIVKLAVNQSGWGPIESARERQLEPSERWRDTTPEFFKAMGEMQGVLSPVQLEFLFRQYTGMLGVSVMRVLTDPVIAHMRGAADIPKAEGTEADTPFVGGVFQREGRYLLDRAYQRVEEINRAKKTYDALLERGNRAEALRFAQEKSEELAMADIAGWYRQAMGEELKRERQIRNAPNIASDRKQQMIEAARGRENAYAKAFLARVDKTTDR